MPRHEAIMEGLGEESSCVLCGYHIIPGLIQYDMFSFKWLWLPSGIGMHERKLEVNEEVDTWIEAVRYFVVPSLLPPRCWRWKRSVNGSSSPSPLLFFDRSSFPVFFLDCIWPRPFSNVQELLFLSLLTLFCLPLTSSFLISSSPLC